MINDFFSKTKYFLGLVLFLAIISSGSNVPQSSDYSVKDQAFSNDQNQLKPDSPSQASTQVIPEKISQPASETQVESQPQVQSQVQTKPENKLSNDNYYTNVDGNTVHSPAYSTEPNTIPAGASAICRDGTYSFSQSRRGTCSHHGGVVEWL
ncbi:MAG: DUF3761 domain-containing protein [Candidatus Paceibacterota bacterium]